MRVCRIILDSEPDHFNALNILGAIQLQQGDFYAARENLVKAIACKPDNVEAHTNLGSSLDALQQHSEAKRCYQRALELNPDYAPALTKLGNSLSREGDYTGALPHYQRALIHTPEDPVLHNNCGMALAHGGCYREALDEYQHALEIQPDYRTALANRGSALSNLKRFQDAAASYTRLLAVEPHNREALAKGFMARRHICDWQGFDQTRDTLLAANGAENLTPFALLSLTDSGSRQLAGARTFSAKFSTAAAPPAVASRENNDKIRIAYISADFREHPLSYLMVGVFEQQDRSRFELTGVSLQASDDSAMGRRVFTAFDSWLDVSSATDQQGAAGTQPLQLPSHVDHLLERWRNEARQADHVRPDLFRRLEDRLAGDHACRQRAALLQRIRGAWPRARPRMKSRQEKHKWPGVPRTPIFLRLFIPKPPIAACQALLKAN